MQAAGHPQLATASATIHSPRAQQSRTPVDARLDSACSGGFRASVTNAGRVLRNTSSPGHSKAGHSKAGHSKAGHHGDVRPTLAGSGGFRASTSTAGRVLRDTPVPGHSKARHHGNVRLDSVDSGCPHPMLAASCAAIHSSAHSKAAHHGDVRLNSACSGGFRASASTAGRFLHNTPFPRTQPSRAPWRCAACFLIPGGPSCTPAGSGRWASTR